MINRVLFVILISFSVYGCSLIETEKTYAEKMNLNGNVKSIKETSYSAVEKFGKAALCVFIILILLLWALS